METIKLIADIPVLLLKATSFPEGILAAHEKLQQLVPPVKNRRFFGISRPEKNLGIVYKAAAEEMEEQEGTQLNLDVMSVKAGNYLSITLPGFAKDPDGISRTFAEILLAPGLDPQGYCVELYSEDRSQVQCMVRLADKPLSTQSQHIQ